MKYVKSKKVIILIGLFCTFISNGQATIQTMKDPKTGRTVYIDGAVKIDGCDAGLVRFETGYVCKSRVPKPPPKSPTPAPIYPPAGTVCKADYEKPEFESCPPGYFSGNSGTHDGNTWCKMTAAQKALCTVIYPPALPDPGPGHDFGHQIGYRGPDGQLHETRDPNSPTCGGCKDGGPTDRTDDTNGETGSSETGSSETGGSETGGSETGGGE